MYFLLWYIKLIRYVKDNIYKIRFIYSKYKLRFLKITLITLNIIFSSFILIINNNLKLWYLIIFSGFYIYFHIILKYGISQFAQPELVQLYFESIRMWFIYIKYNTIYEKRDIMHIAIIFMWTLVLGGCTAATLPDHNEVRILFLIRNSCKRDET